MAASFNNRKMYSIVERMDGCKYFIEIIIITLKERIAGANFFGNKHSTAGRITFKYMNYFGMDY